MVELTCWNDQWGGLKVFFHSPSEFKALRNNSAPLWLCACVCGCVCWDGEQGSIQQRATAARTAGTHTHRRHAELLLKSPASSPQDYRCQQNCTRNRPYYDIGAAGTCREWMGSSEEHRDQRGRGISAAQLTKPLRRCLETGSRTEFWVIIENHLHERKN